MVTGGVKMDLKALDRMLCGEIWTGSETWRNLLYLCDECGHRFVGSSGYRKAAEQGHATAKLRLDKMKDK